MTHPSGHREIQPVSDEFLPFNHNAHQALTGPAQATHELLEGTVRRCDYFATDATDEFTIVREDGREQGIFKVWAAPVIPVLETGDTNVDQALETWSGRLHGAPLSLFESLEQWRAFSAVADRRLQQVFETRPMPTDPEDALAEQFARLSTAFAYAAPFYNLEAVVADSRENRHDNPIDFSEDHAAGGKLDAVAMLLPAALRDHVLADRLDWHGLNWEALTERIEAMRSDFLSGTDSQSARQYVQISKVAALANMEPVDILFAANALQFIPADVGGKREDLPQAEAMAALDSVLNQPAGVVTTGAVAKDANALIRFHNWSTVHKSPDNFAGKYWAYDAVCATAAQLVDAIQAQPDTAFDEWFARTFTAQLAPQLNGLDASSAKGRFMLQLFNEGKFRTTLTDKILARSQECYRDAGVRLAEMRQSERLLPIGEQAPTFLVGGKTIGLNRATQLFGSERVLGGSVITTEAVEDWLSQVEGVGPLVQSLESATDPAAKVAIGERIIASIHESAVPPELIAAIQRSFAPDAAIVLRSSSFDEDVDIIGPAPGVYESEINIHAADDRAVGAALKQVVSSFFSDKAISFRELKGLRHVPLFAVLAQEFQPGAGGSIFIKDGAVTLNIAPSPSQINDIHDEALAFEEHVLHDSSSVDGVESAILSATHVKDIVAMATAAERIWGASDLEFVVNPATDVVQLLQMRSLERPVAHEQYDNNAVPATALSITSIDDLPELAADHPVALVMGENIDLEKFQGPLFRWVVSHRAAVRAIVVPHAIPGTCHFVNIIESLGIKVEVAEQ